MCVVAIEQVRLNSSKIDTDHNGRYKLAFAETEQCVPEMRRYVSRVMRFDQYSEPWNGSELEGMAMVVEVGAADADESATLNSRRTSKKQEKSIWIQGLVAEVRLASVRERPQRGQAARQHARPGRSRVP